MKALTTFPALFLVRLLVVIILQSSERDAIVSLKTPIFPIRRRVWERWEGLWVQATLHGDADLYRYYTSLRLVLYKLWKEKSWFDAKRPPLLCLLIDSFDWRSGAVGSNMCLVEFVTLFLPESPFELSFRVNLKGSVWLLTVLMFASLRELTNTSGCDKDNAGKAADQKI